jgi:hypothetical protein
MYKIITSSISLLLFSIILMSCSNSNNREKINSKQSLKQIYIIYKKYNFMTLLAHLK